MSATDVAMVKLAADWSEARNAVVAFRGTISMLGAGTRLETAIREIDDAYDYAAKKLRDDA